jgi:hypothetical protein
LRPVAGAADQLEDELARLQSQRDRYAMAAEAATDAKVSLAHLRNVERLEEEIEALRKALDAMPSEQASAGTNQAVTLGFDYGEDEDEQTRVFDASVLQPEAESEAAAAVEQPLAKPVIAASDRVSVPAPSADESPTLAPEVEAYADEGPAALEISTPFGRRIAQPLSPFDVSSSGPIDLDLPPSGLRRASTVLLVIIVLGGIAGALWWAFEPPPRPVERETKSTPTVIEAAPVPSDAQHR